MTQRVALQPLTDINSFAGCGAFSWHKHANFLSCSDPLITILHATSPPRTLSDLSMFINSDDRVRFKDFVTTAGRSSRHHEQDFRLVLPDAALGVINVRLHHEPDRSGNEETVHAMVLDVTGSRLMDNRTVPGATADVRSEKHFRLLMSEINHRSKNVLGLVQSIARMTRQSDPDRFLALFEARLQALAASYDLLLDRPERGVDMHDLAAAQFAHIQDPDGARMSADGPHIKLTAEAAQGLGMAFHELATNAAKYGALHGSKGKVAVTWKMRDDGEDGFEITWREVDGPPVKPPASEGFGTTVIGPMAEAALNGKVDLHYEPDGLVWHAVCGHQSLA